MYPIIRRSFPRQALPISQKDEKWRKQCVDACVTLALYNSDTKMMESKYNMRANYKLYDGILDQRDVEATMNPWGLDATTFPAKMHCYPVASNKINVLVGEESKRRFDWRLRVTNDDAVSEKEKFIKQTMLQQLTAMALEGVEDENVAKQKVEELQKWSKYEAQDIRERAGTHILKHLWEEQKLRLKFNQGYKDGLIGGLEIYSAELVAGKPVLRKVNPLNIYTVGISSSPYIEDADIIVEDIYQSVGWVIDNYYDVLTKEQIDSIERGNQNKSSGNPIIDYPASNNPFLRYSSSEDGTIDITNNSYGNGAYDEEGNIRVVRCVWKSRRLIKKLKYYENNEVLYTIVDEKYKPDITKGEEVEELWINEWWEGTRIGYDIYINMQPRPVQFRRMDNLSMCKSGYVGTIYNTNSNRTKSLMDKMKPYLYMYNVLMYRLEKAIAKYKGPIIELDMAKMPDGWEFEKWMYMGEEMGYLPIDSFKEADKGAATGKLAGAFNTTQKIWNPDMGNYIVHTLELIKYIEESLGKSIGITPQREGAIDNRETVGGVERSVTQSSHATEEYFLTHDFTKLRALEALLEVAKYAYRNDNKVAQYVLDDLGQEIFNFDGGEFTEADYGLVMSDGSMQQELRNSLVQLAQAGLQNDKLNFSAFMDIYMSQSISDTRRKIEQYEQDFIERQQQAQEAQMQHEKEIQQMQIENREDEQQHQMDIEILKSNTQIELKLMELDARANESTEAPNNNMDYEKLEVQKDKINKDNILNTAKLQEIIRSSKVKEAQKNEEIAIKRKQANKPKPTSK